MAICKNDIILILSVYSPIKSVSTNPLKRMKQKAPHSKWKVSSLDLVSNLSDLFTDANSADVTLVSDDQIQFEAHKLVLSASSPVLKNLLLDNLHSPPLIYLRGVKQEELLSILQYMYRGEAAVHIHRVNHFLNNAEDLQIKQLTYCFDSGYTFASNEEDDAVYEDNIEHIRDNDEHRNDSNSTTGTVDNILPLNIPTYNPENMHQTLVVSGLRVRNVMQVMN